MDKYLLGIETSCDDTSVALVNEAGDIKQHVKVSQDHLLNQYGGVYPEFASRAHVASIIPVIDKVLTQSQVDIEQDIVGIAVTRGPGLVGSLMIGTTTANTLGVLWNKPVYGVNHLKGHLKSAELEGAQIDYPAIVLLVSGGHTFICYIDEADNITMVGQTRDDSLGEAYDKLGRMLGLPFPAGPKIDQLALQGTPNIPFPRPLINKGHDFSFSGLKSAVSRYIDGAESYDAADICASFVASVLDILDNKLNSALTAYPAAQSLVIVGGVAASQQVRELGAQMADQYQVTLKLPPLRWATDNGAMIALAGWDYHRNAIHTKAIPKARIPIDEY